MDDSSTIFHEIVNTFNEFTSTPNAYRSLLILVGAILVMYWVSKYVANAIIYLAQKVATRSDTESDKAKFIRLRQIETYLGVTVAIVRAVVVAVAAYVIWRTISPEGSKQLGGSSAAAIGASAFFIVFAGQTLGTILRDITAGATMIIEGWFNVGDYIKVEPFWDVSGVVERLTLRSTRIRSLSGEEIIIHNQKIDAVHVTPDGVRTWAVEVFVNDAVLGRKFVQKVINTLPTGPTMLARAPEIIHSDTWTDDVWRITVEAKTPPGRDWLIEKHFINALNRADQALPKQKRLLVDEPIAHWANDIAERRFSRAVRVNNQ